MTVADDAPAGSREPPRVPARVDRLLRRLGIGVIVLAVVVGAGWRVAAASATSGVSVNFDAQPIVCEGAEVELRPPAHGDVVISPAVVLQAGMECRLRILVINDGWSDATVESISLPMLSAGNALRLEVRLVNPNGQRGVERDDGAVVFDLTGPVGVAAGGAQVFEALIDYGGGAQLDECAAMSWNDPAVTVSVLGVATELMPPEHDLVWFQQGSLAGCEEFS